jgi:predicted lipoprotein with Yx(FWY)xxD motif
MRKLTELRVLLALLLLSGALVAGCGSSASSSTSVAAASSSTTSGATSTAATTTSTSTSASAAGGGAAIEITTKHDKKLGTILAAGSKELTVYLFEADTGGASACTGPCARFWPPVTGTATASGHAHANDLGTITRADGTTQVTYKGHPLYYFIKDKDDGDAYGQGSTAFGAGWYVLTPGGAKVDNS